MKKLNLKSLKLSATDILERAELKSITGSGTCYGCTSNQICCDCQGRAIPTCETPYNCMYRCAMLGFTE